MQRVWEALNRAGIVWGAFWLGVWVAGSLLLRGVASLLMKLDIAQVNAVLGPLVAKTDAFLGLALQLVVWVLTFPLKGYEGVSGVFGFVGATLVSTLSLFFVLFVLTLLVAGAQAWKRFVEGGAVVVLEGTKAATDTVQEAIAQKANEAAFFALQSLVTKYPALNGLPRDTAALPKPPAQSAALTNADAWRVFSLDPQYASAYVEADTRRLYLMLRGQSGDQARADAAWVNVCAQRGWRP